MPGEFESILTKLQGKLGKQTIKRASTINRPRPKLNVIQIKAINDFVKRNPRADGGSVNGSYEAALRKKIEELMDDGYEFGEAVREAMRQGYEDGGKATKGFENITAKNKSKIRSKLNKKLNEPNIAVSRVTKKGPTYVLNITGRTPVYSTDLEKLKKQRDKIISTIEKPLRSQGFVSLKELEKFLVDSGFDVSGIKAKRGLKQSISRIADLYGIEKKKAPGKKGSEFFYKIPTKEKLKEIIISRGGPEARVPIAKKLIKDLDIKSMTQLNKVMSARGYGLFSDKFMQEKFPEIKGVAFSDPKFVPPMSKNKPRNVLNQIRYDLRKTMSSLPTENFLRDYKKAQNYGQSVHTMHTTAKRKKTGLINIDDLAFGSMIENDTYAQGLDRMRSGMVTTLNNIKNTFSKVKPNTVVTVPLNLQRDYNFPKTMKLKELIDRVNIGLTDLAYKTDGKVRGELLEITNKGMRFVNNPVKNYNIIPGQGLVKGTTKDLEPVIKKFRTDKSGKLLLDEKGELILKKNKTLTQSEAEDVFSITENMKKQLPEAAKTKPVSLKEKILSGTGKVLRGVGKVVKPVSVAMGPYAVMSAASKADDMGIKLGLGDQAMAFYMGDPQAAIDMYRMRNDPEYAQQVRAANYARPLDEGTYDAIDESFTSYFDGGIVSVLKGVK